MQTQYFCNKVKICFFSTKLNFFSLFFCELYNFFVRLILLKIAFFVLEEEEFSESTFFF